MRGRSGGPNGPDQRDREYRARALGRNRPWTVHRANRTVDHSVLANLLDNFSLRGAA